MKHALYLKSEEYFYSLVDGENITVSGVGAEVVKKSTEYEGLFFNHEDGTLKAELVAAVAAEDSLVFPKEFKYHLEGLHNREVLEVGRVFVDHDGGVSYRVSKGEIEEFQNITGSTLQIFFDEYAVVTERHDTFIKLWSMDLSIDFVVEVYSNDNSNRECRYPDPVAVYEHTVRSLSEAFSIQADELKKHDNCHTSCSFSVYPEDSDDYEEFDRILTGYIDWVNTLEGRKVSLSIFDNDYEKFIPDVGQAAEFCGLDAGSLYEKNKSGFLVGDYIMELHDEDIHNYGLGLHLDTDDLDLTSIYKKAKGLETALSTDYSRSFGIKVYYLTPDEDSTVWSVYRPVFEGLDIHKDGINAKLIAEIDSSGGCMVFHEGIQEIEQDTRVQVQVTYDKPFVIKSRAEHYPENLDPTVPY